MIRTREEWERIRARGRTRFLLIQGLLGRALPMALLTLLVLVLVEGRAFDATLLQDRNFLIRLALGMALFAVGGVASAYARWRATETRFAEEDRSDS